MKAGVYIHIPFCKSKCSYCNFYSSANLRLTTEVVDAICNEIRLRKNYLSDRVVETIYFGGGTPSLLNLEQLSLILKAVFTQLNVLPSAEITIEANPDDIHTENLIGWKKLGVNRLSIGTQSFEDSDLQYLNRRHDGKKSLNAILMAQHTGFENISVDLIFGVPNQSDESIMNFLQKSIFLNVPHISAYALTVEPETALGSLIQRKRKQIPSEEQMVSQFLMISDFLQRNAYDQYEISNYALNGFESKHNSNYWNGVHYLGIGPSAHSYNGISRQWNVADIKKYIKAISENHISCEIEMLSEIQLYNEYIMTSIRTSKGIDLDYIKKNFDKDIFSEFNRLIIKFIDSDDVIDVENHIILTRKGKLFADRIASELFITEN